MGSCLIRLLLALIVITALQGAPSAQADGVDGTQPELSLGYGTMNGNRTSSMQGSSAVSLGVTTICCAKRLFRPFLGTELTSVSSSAFVNSTSYTAQDYSIAMKLGLSFEPGNSSVVGPVFRASFDFGFHNLSLSGNGPANTYTGAIYGQTFGVGVRLPIGTHALMLFAEYKIRNAVSTPVKGFNLTGYFFTLGYAF